AERSEADAPPPGRLPPRSPVDLGAAGERGGSDPAALPEAAGLRPGVLHQGGFRMVEPPDRAALLVPRLPARVAGAGEAEPGRTEPLGQLLRRVLADQAGGGVQGAEEERHLQRVAGAQSPAGRRGAPAELVGE